jgi:hypothetical protein
MTSFLLYLLLIFPLIAVIVAHSASVVTVLVAVERILKKRFKAFLKNSSNFGKKKTGLNFFE